MSKLGTYAVHWCIIQFDKEIAQIMKRPLTHHGFLLQGNLAMRHCPSKERAEEMRDAAVEEMKQQKRNGRAFIITGEQFTAGSTRYGISIGDYTVESYHMIQGVSEGWVTMFPVTATQINESITF